MMQAYIVDFRIWWDQEGGVLSVSTANFARRVRPSGKLGEALVKEGVLTDHQLQYALQVQQDSVKRRRLGDIVVDLGYVTKRQLRDVSKKYNHRLTLGAILIDNGSITEEQLAEASEKVRATGRQLGEVLISEGVLSEEQLATALSQQLDYPHIVPSKRLVDRMLVRQFPESLLRQHGALPLFKNQDVVTFLVGNPLDRDLLRTLDTVVGQKFELAIGPQSQIRKLIDEIINEQSLLSQAPTVATDDITTSSFRRYDLAVGGSAVGMDGQVISVVDLLLSNAIRQRASDIHIDSMYNKLRVRYRVDGKLVFETDLPKHLGERMHRRIKVLANMDLGDSSDTADGHMYVAMDGTNVDLRVSFYPTVLGPSVTIRALSRDIGLKDLADLGMLPTVLQTLKLMLDSPSGLILFAGPTGSGKTTSLYACLNYLNKDDVKICTIEAPVEYSIEGVAQCQVRGASEKQMSEKIKAMMHQDPDVIVLGEINDEPTALSAAQAALSGHKVFSTIHADDTFGAILRLMEMGLRTYLLSSTGVAVISQRLVRQICSDCKEPFTPPREIFKQFRLSSIDPDRWQFFRGRGCASCNNTGFHGRSGVFELLALDDEIRNAFLADNNAASVRKLAENTSRFLSLRAAGFIKALQGITTLDETFGFLSYSEQQAFSSTNLSEEMINFWMGKSASLVP